MRILVVAALEVSLDSVEVWSRGWLCMNSKSVISWGMILVGVFGREKLGPRLRTLVISVGMWEDEMFCIQFSSPLGCIFRDKFFCCID